MSFGPTSREATPDEVNIFIRKTDEWYAEYMKIISPEFRDKVYATKDSQLIDDYESEVDRAAGIKTAINATVGTWAAFKSGYASVTDYTSTVIGDAIDWIRGIFGGGPIADMAAYSVSPISGGQLGRYSVSPISGGQLGAFGALGILQLPAIVWITGILALMALSYVGMKEVIVRADAWWIKKDDPTMPWADALGKAKDISERGGIIAALPLVAAAAIAAFLIFGKKR